MVKYKKATKIFLLIALMVLIMFVHTSCAGGAIKIKTEFTSEQITFLETEFEFLKDDDMEIKGVYIENFLRDANYSVLLQIPSKNISNIKERFLVNEEDFLYYHDIDLKLPGGEKVIANEFFNDNSGHTFSKYYFENEKGEVFIYIVKERLKDGEKYYKMFENIK